MAERRLTELLMWRFGDVLRKRYGTSGNGLIGRMRLIVDLEIEKKLVDSLGKRKPGRKKGRDNQLLEAVDELKSQHPQMSDSEIIRRMLKAGEGGNPARLRQHAKTWRNRLSRARAAAKKAP